MKSTNTGSIKMSILLSILLALSGMAVMALADQLDPDPHPPNKFSGNVTLNGADAFTGVVIDAYIDGDHRGNITVESSGKYGDFAGLTYLDVTGNASDDGKTITFTVCGAAADQNATWYAYEAPRILNLTAVDDEAPAVENANANPTSIVNGTDTTQLNVTVIDGCRCTVGNVTVNLSAIGGLEAQEMDRVGDTDVYSVTTNATEGTALGAYCMPVNASDVFGNCNTSVCIALEVTTPGLPKTGDIDGSSGDPTMSDAVYLAKHVVGLSGYETIYADGDIDGSGGDPTMSDAVYLAKHVVGLSGYETIYP